MHQSHMPQPPMYPPQRRPQQEFHPYHHHMPPHSPIHPYGAYQHPAHYYPHPHGPPPQFAQQRWQQPYPNPQAYMPPPPPQIPQAPHVPYQPRSPMVVTSQPYSQPMTPSIRQTPVQPPHMMQPVSHSPRPTIQHVPSYTHTPVAPPSPAPTPKYDTAPTPKQEQVMPQPTRLEIATPLAPAVQPPQPSAANVLLLPPEHKMPIYPKLPWYSYEAGASSFPPRAARRRRRKENQNLDDVDTVALPTRKLAEAEFQEQVADEAASETSTLPAPSEPETPATSQAPSETDFTIVSAPTTPAQATFNSPKPTAASTQHARRDTRTAIAVPNIPGIARPKPSPPATSDKPIASPTSQAAPVSTSGEQKSETANGEQPADEAAVPAAPPPKPAPKSWADLVRRNAPPPSTALALNGAPPSNGFQIPKSASLADALRQYSVQSDSTLTFLEPRGLVNTGNMCYMNSVSTFRSRRFETCG